MGDLNDFLKKARNEGKYADLTSAEKAQFAAEHEWSWPDKPTVDEAMERAQAHNSPEAVEKRREEGNLDFESVIAAVDAIVRLAGLTKEEKEELDDIVFNIKYASREDMMQAFKGSIYSYEEVEYLVETLRYKDELINGPLRDKIVGAIQEKGLEDSIIELLGAIHDNWMRNHSNNFQKERKR